MTAPRVPGGNPADPFPIVNQALDILAHQEVYGVNPATTTGLTWGYLGGRWGGFVITTGTVSLTDNAENYIVVERSSGAVSVSTATTNWNNQTTYARVFHLTTLSGVVSTTRDYRGGPGGVHGQAAAGSGGANVNQTKEMMCGFISTPSDKDYRLVLKAAHAGSITETTTRSESGTCTATFKVNTTALGGTANSVSSSEQSQAHTSSNTFAEGDDLVLTVSSNASCAGLSFTVKYTRTLES